LDPSLALLGGGNTSVKGQFRHRFGLEEEVLYIKASGAELAKITELDFVALRLGVLREWQSADVSGDEQLAEALRAARVSTSSVTADPSVETLLHAILPWKYVDHTHPDAVLAICNTPDGQDQLRRIYGSRAPVVPYVKPGIELARRCNDIYRAQATDETIGVVLMNHGLVSFADTASQAYRRMLELVRLAEEHLKERGAWNVGAPDSPAVQTSEGGFRRADLAELRFEISRIADAPMLMQVDADPESQAYCHRTDCAEISERGSVTPDHVTFTKPKPMVGRDVRAYAAWYADYVREHSGGRNITPLDPAPRVVLDREFGLVTVGRTVAAATMVRDIYRHTITAIQRSEALSQYRPLTLAQIFEVEYWQPQQAKARRRESALPLTGQIALVTGAASGIGRACVESLVERGAAVAGFDVNPLVSAICDSPSFVGVVCDLTDAHALSDALDTAVRNFGGIDALILNAGVFPASEPISEISPEAWRKTMTVNVDANLMLLHQAYPLLKCAPSGGRVVVVGSKNVPAPGRGAAAYSASKSALTQLARVAALEWAKDGIRVNVVHPNAVFDTGLWTVELLEQRAAMAGLTVDDYKTSNLLRTEVRSRDVAEMIAEMCGALFDKTTGAQIPIDGGTERVV